MKESHPIPTSNMKMNEQIFMYGAKQLLSGSEQKTFHEGSFFPHRGDCVCSGSYP